MRLNLSAPKRVGLVIGQSIVCDYSASLLQPPPPLLSVFSVTYSYFILPPSFYSFRLRSFDTRLCTVHVIKTHDLTVFVRNASAPPDIHLTHHIPLTEFIFYF